MSNKNPTTKQRDELVRPAFASNAQAFGFLALVVFALVLPALISASGLISRRNAYEIMPENQGAYSFVKSEVFDNKEDIDILFVGSSVIWNAVDTPQVQAKLSEKLGRPARVATFGHYFNSIDISYMQIRDLLARKRVRMVVLSIPRMSFTEGPSTTAYKFIQYGDDREIFDGLPLKDKIALYACSVLRSPHDLLTLTRANKAKKSPYADNLGADKQEMGMGRNPDRFEEFNPPAPSVPVSKLLYSPDNQEPFQFTNDGISSYQNYYLKKLVEKLKQSGVSLMILNVPQYSERQNSKIIERKDWSKHFGMSIPLVGIAPTVLYAGLSEDEVEKLHYDDEHLNKNGSEYFTRTALPAILEVYEKNAAKNY